jgi:putative inorganic carbon (hco3(-)) transporter
LKNKIAPITLLIILAAFIGGSVMGRVSPVAFSVSKLAAVGLVLFYVIRVNLRTFHFPRMLFFYLGFICWVIVSGYFFASSYHTTLSAVKTPIQIFLFIFVTYGVFRSIRSLEPLAYAFVLSVAFVMFGDLLGVNFGIEQGNRYQGLTYNSNVFGLFMNYLIISIIYLLQDATRKILIRYTLYALGALAIIMIMGTGSRSAFLAMVAVFFVYLVSVRKYNHKTILLIVITGVGGVMFYNSLIEVFMGTATIQRIQNESYLIRGATIRYENILAAYQVFLDNPVTGVGLDNFKYFNPLGFAAHNYPLEILASTGSIGFILLIVLYIQYFIKYRNYREQGGDLGEVLYMRLFLTITIVWSMVFHLYNAPEHWIFISASLGVMQGKTNDSVVVTKRSI